MRFVFEAMVFTVITVFVCLGLVWVVFGPSPTSAAAPLACTELPNNSPYSITRCENAEVICYRGIDGPMECKWK